MYTAILHVTIRQPQRIEIPKPTIWAPIRLWTGKQVFSCLLKIVASMSGTEARGMDLVGRATLNKMLYGPYGKEAT